MISFDKKHKKFVQTDSFGIRTAGEAFTAYKRVTAVSALKRSDRIIAFISAYDHITVKQLVFFSGNEQLSFVDQRNAVAQLFKIGRYV